ncbi:MAG TPA: potassium transporter TrkG [Parapedobacter sp.]|uniref:TrkH family potassium uptake protein n=1 Tax=Parapedobacter sp. TaxID=1958893 RepID=UPI002D1313D1|nr:potassium transporter TrkG [Parapedobacter sp.]HWK55864.1 potassium transporter TrkG [Parapedobacter sp.]
MLSDIKYIFKYRESTVDRVMLYVSLVCALVVLFHLGYNTDKATARQFAAIIKWLFYGLFFLGALRIGFSMLAVRKVGVAHYGGLVLSLYFLTVILARVTEEPHLAFLQNDEWLYLGIFAVFLTELSKSSLFFDNFYFNPTILFVISFLVLILVGTLLLMLPKTTAGAPLPFVDALFMATSAVCITGLATVDIATQFTEFGHTVILILIQLGGLGIMTFTGFFGYFFSGGFSYKNQLMYSEFLGQNKVASVISTLLKIIFVTLFFEVVGAVFIFFSTEAADFETYGDRAFFSVFHAVSAFCNAGFTTAAGGLNQAAFRFNYEMQVVLSLLFILGGLGFGIVFNTYTFIKRWAVNVFLRVFHSRPYIYRAWVISFNTRLIMWATLLLVVFSTVATFVLEYNHTLAAHQTLWGKWISAFFTGNSARAAGFSVAEVSSFSLPMLATAVFLMWVGASPGSTGGGIKTTTFTVALLNIVNLARGKDKLEIFGREVSTDSVSKAFAIIVLSFLAVGTTMFGLAITDSHLGLLPIAFESFSAYATCGLSLGITPQLSAAGKVIVICSMFVGRVGLLTLLVALIKNTKNRSYEYPQEKILF